MASTSTATIATTATATMTPRVAATVRSKNPLKGAVEVMPQRLYYAALKSPPPSHNILASCPRRKKAQVAGEKKQIHFFNMDNELVYWNFFLDFGPLNLGQLHRFSIRLGEKLRKFPVVCFYSSAVPAKRANAIFLICAWQMLFLGRSPEQAYQGFERHNNSYSESGEHGADAGHLHFKSNASLPPVSTSQGAVTVAPLPPWHDASPCACTYDLNVLDCLQGMAKAMTCGFYDKDTFDLQEYEHFEQVENGDLNWLCKGRILAFAGPSYERHVSPEGYCTLSPADYIPYFLQNNVSLVVRLNKKAYHEQDFVDAGINHVEAFFVDGSCPPMKILQGVIEAFESVPKDEAFAVHCKAGLGRTGTCIGAYLMKHYRFTAREVIAWMRICRPGCVIGPQQHFLTKIEPLMWQQGEAAGLIERPIATTRASSRSVKMLEASSPTETVTASDTTQEDEDEGGDSSMQDAVVGRAGQAEALLAARAGRRSAAAPVSTPTRNSTTSVPITPDGKEKVAVKVAAESSSKKPSLWCA